MKSYQYQLVRYMHDRVTGEFVNIGVLLYCADDNFLKCRLVNKYARITGFFAGSNGKNILRALKQLDLTVKRYSAELFVKSDKLVDISKSILPKNDGSLYFTDVKAGIDLDLDKCLSELYQIFVAKWQEETDEPLLKDSDVWKDKYKKYFDKYGLTEKLTEKSVQTQYDTFSFDKAYKNEIWHCYQPISFDLQNTDSIRAKVYKWSGKIREISNQDEKIELTFLTSVPKRHNNLSSFIRDSLTENYPNISVNIIHEIEAESFAIKLLGEINAHGI